MAQLPAGIALHSLCLAIASIMVRAFNNPIISIKQYLHFLDKHTSAFITCCRARVSGKSTPAHESASICTTRGVSPSPSRNATKLVGASPRLRKPLLALPPNPDAQIITHQMSRISAGVATAPSSTASREP